MKKIYQSPQTSHMVIADCYVLQTISGNGAGIGSGGGSGQAG